MIVAATVVGALALLWFVTPAGVVTPRGSEPGGSD
jgi:hypothetical protein